MTSASTAADAATAGDCLQPFVLSADFGGRGLYFRLFDDLGRAMDGAGEASIAPGWTLRLDTQFNGFFERYWRDLTGLRSLALVMMTSGPCRIRAMRRHHNTVRVLAETMASGEATQSILPVALADLPIEDAIIYAEVQALGGASTVHDGAWHTHDPPRNDVRLAIVTCSFGRERLLVDNLYRLSDVVARTADIECLLIVNQGRTDLAGFAPYKSLATTAIGAKLHLIRQDNFGGTGGFTRGMIDSLARSATHVLLLDDDIRIEPAVLERLIALLRRLEAPATIGGQMLDLDSPTMLHASHETVRLGVLRLFNPCAGLDMTSPDVIDALAARHRSDYNAWWFCCIPASTIKTIGLPIPMFVRHDDVEYGVRSVASGTPAIAFPGIFVWHQGYAKKQSWSFIYYDRRNVMITAALHGRLRSLRVGVQHWRLAWGALRNLRFEYCWAICRAAEDFLLGPDAVFTNLPARHRQLTRDQSRPTLLTMAAAQHFHRSPNKRRTLRRLSPTAAMLRGTRGLDLREAKIAMTARALAFATIRTSFALVRHGGRVSAVYRAHAPTCTSFASWRDMLGMPPAPDEGS